MVLAAIGIYGVMAYAVAQRTQDIGIRMAMGAQIKDVLKMVLGRGIVLTLIGVAIGIVGALSLTRAMKALLFGVTPTDAATFVVVSIGLILVAMLAISPLVARQKSIRSWRCDTSEGLMSWSTSHSHPALAG
jgi:putative ABC transport system permease protein